MPRARWPTRTPLIAGRRFLHRTEMPSPHHASPGAAAEWLATGIRALHEDGARRTFLEDVWRNRATVREVTSAFDIFEQDSLPVFLLGGSSHGKIVIVAVNPGESIEGEKEKGRSLKYYQALHENAFIEIPRLLDDAKALARSTKPLRRIKSTSPFWGALHRCVSIFSGTGEVPASAADRWRYYARTCVVQDLIPFHSRSAREIPLTPTGPLGDIAAAVFDGIAKSRARCAMVASRQGYRLLEQWAASRDVKTIRIPLPGRTRSGKARSVQTLMTVLGDVRVLAIDNALVTQPTFPWEDGYRLQLATVVRDW
jgi:hypothetical protein